MKIVKYFTVKILYTLQL